MKINDLVIRKKYQGDIVFRVIGKMNDIFILKGEFVRLIADAREDDLEEYIPNKKQNLILPRIKSFDHYVKGKVLHIDGDELYLRRAMEAYSKYKVEAFGYYIKEGDMKYRIKELLIEHNPDILVITGHDSFKSKEDKYKIESYINSKFFVDTVLEARKVRSDKDDLIIIAGACQSYFEELIKAGANFASSPNRNNIHLLDPVIIASFLANSRINEPIDIEYILVNTISKELGGIETHGKARKIYVGGSHYI